MTDIFQVLCHVRKLIEGDTSGYAQVYVCQSSHKFSVTTLEQDGHGIPGGGGVLDPCLGIGVPLRV